MIVLILCSYMSASIIPLRLSLPEQVRVQATDGLRVKSLVC
jgi:hypothetical protein